MAEIGVAHLVRARNGVEPFRRFLDSYARFPGGVDHDLLIIYKGFKHPVETREYHELLKPFQHQDLFVSDFGFDLRAYSLAARHFKNTRLCFLNSFTVIQGEVWLRKLDSLAVQPGVGLVGATGSCESMLTNLVHAPAKGNFLLRSLKTRINSVLFKPFPNHHIRTTGFIISRSVMLDVWPRYIVTKQQAYMFENGRNGLSQRILRRNLKMLVAGRDGRGYEMEEWAASNTFRQSSQQNLLLADNQTRQFDQADAATRLKLSRMSWGEQANPANSH